jgi:hypothetical protein
MQKSPARGAGADRESSITEHAGLREHHRPCHSLPAIRFFPARISQSSPQSHIFGLSNKGWSFEFPKQPSGSRPEPRAFPEYTPTAEIRKTTPAGAVFHPEQDFTGRGRPSAAPFDSSSANPYLTPMKCFCCEDTGRVCEVHQRTLAPAVPLARPAPSAIDRRQMSPRACRKALSLMLKARRPTTGILGGL